ncbi:hypothetical protein F511_41440 [Dorcoceras hygrometricum]|uniref:Uncharacterized protein n=1 Tax=Dorcoceras hygrometricum TaxID=472368 RepID=A0A2Z7C0W5_9LAMI|nr:hypothetical protein F511_41440 [Dorcoceras hygrometricum]
MVLAGSPATYAEAVDRAVDIEESLLEASNQIQPTAGRTFQPVIEVMQPFQPPHTSQQSNRQRFKPRGKQFKKRENLSSSGSRLETSPHDPLGITDSACKNQSVMVRVQYGPFNTYIPIRSTTIGISRVARDPITMHTSWRSNSDIACVTSIGYPCTRASGESSTTKHRLLHASGPHPIPPPNDPIRVDKQVKVRHLSCRVSMTFRVVRTSQYNQDLGLIHSTNGNHLESPNEGSSIDHQVTIHLHAQNITIFPTNETWYFASQMLVSSSGSLILILTAQ